MAESLTMGHDPMTLRLRLVEGSGFVWEEVLSEAWPTGATLTLVVGADSWPATISGSVASWDIAEATTAAVPDGTPASLIYSEGGAPVVLGLGTVVRRDS